ncbi:MAG: hypothetical protein U0840_13075 [Gemmataceae bacterium]
MDRLYGLLLLTGLYPWWRAWRATTGTTLRGPLVWLLTAWLWWVGMAVGPGGREGHYVGLCLLGAAGVAVLGARRPGAAAWNGVVGGLLAALALPLVQGMGALRAEPAQLLFLAAVLAVGVGNYVPTRLGAAALALGGWAGVELAVLADWLDELPTWWGVWLAGVPWLGLASRPGGGGDALDRCWQRFRDGYGIVWAQRVSEQYARAAEAAGLAVELRWHGVQGEAGQRERSLELLRAVLRRFGSTATEQV